MLITVNAAFRDRGAGRERNQTRPTDEAPRDGPRGGQGARVRGGELPSFRKCCFHSACSVGKDWD